MIHWGQPVITWKDMTEPTNIMYIHTVNIYNIAYLNKIKSYTFDDNQSPHHRRTNLVVSYPN